MSHRASCMQSRFELTVSTSRSNVGTCSNFSSCNPLAFSPYVTTPSAGTVAVSQIAGSFGLVISVDTSAIACPIDQLLHACFIMWYI